MSVDILNKTKEKTKYNFTESNLTKENINYIKQELDKQSSFLYISKNTGVSVYFIKKIYNGENIKPR